MSTRIAVVALWAPDVPTAAHFYRDVLGLTLLPHHHGDRPHFLVDGIFLTLCHGEPKPAVDALTDRFPLVAFAVPDLDKMVERLEAHSVELPWGVEGNKKSRWVMFHDPAGNLIELVEFEG